MNKEQNRILAAFLLITLLLPWALGAFSVGHECACQACEIAERKPFCECPICAAIRSASEWLEGLILAFAFWAALLRAERGASDSEKNAFTAFTPVRLFVRLND